MSENEHASATIEKIPDAPIVVVTARPTTGDTRQATIATFAAIIRTLDEQTERVFMIADARQLKLGLDDLMVSSSMAARGQDNMLHHPNLRGVVYVLNDGMMKMAVRGLNSATFGHIKAEVFDTVEQAIDYCREQIGELGYQ